MMLYYLRVFGGLEKKNNNKKKIHLLFALFFSIYSHYI